jgi:hypothetical protein
VKGLPLRAYGERWRLFLMKGTEGLERCAGTPQRKIGANHLDDIVRRGDLLDCFCWNTGHRVDFSLVRIG